MYIPYEGTKHRCTLKLSIRYRLSGLDLIHVPAAYFQCINPRYLLVRTDGRPNSGNGSGGEEKIFLSSP